jgi:MFS family permease
MFFLAGWLPAAWATRIPAIERGLGLSAGELALAIAGLEAGAVLGLPAGAALVGRLGSRRALRLGFLVFAPALLAVGLAASLPGLALTLAAMALANSLVDVAMNAQGVELERRAGRSLLSGLHAGHPIGLVAGGLAGTAAAASGVPVAAHFLAVAAVGFAAALVAGAFLVDDCDHVRRAALGRPSRRLLLLGLLAFCAFAIDGAAFNWSAVDLRSEHDASSGTAAAAFTGFALAVAVGRAFGDRLVARHGRVRVVQVSAGVIAAGGAVVVLAPGAALGLAGWALLGVGLAAVAPTLLGAAPDGGEPSPATAIAAVSAIGYLGSFTGPPAIGALAHATGLSTALVSLVAAGAMLGLLAKPALDPAIDIPPRPTIPKLRKAAQRGQRGTRGLALTRHQAAGPWQPAHAKPRQGRGAPAHWRSPAPANDACRTAPRPEHPAAGEPFGVRPART